MGWQKYRWERNKHRRIYNLEPGYLMVVMEMAGFMPREREGGQEKKMDLENSLCIVEGSSFMEHSIMEFSFQLELI